MKKIIVLSVFILLSINAMAIYQHNEFIGVYQCIREKDTMTLIIKNDSLFFIDITYYDPYGWDNIIKCKSECSGIWRYNGTSNALIMTCVGDTIGILDPSLYLLPCNLYYVEFIFIIKNPDKLILHEASWKKPLIFRRKK